MDNPLLKEELLQSWRDYPRVIVNGLEPLTKDKKWKKTRDWALADLFFLMRYVLDRPFMDDDWWFDRCREVQYAPDGFLDLWARGHGKSTVITVGLTILDILRNPEITIGIFSHTKPIAKSFLRVIKQEFATNERLKDLFPDILYKNPDTQAPKWSEDAGITVKRKGNPPESTLEAHGLVDGAPTGRHFNLRVYDDVVTAESVATQEQMIKVMDALDMSNNLGSKDGKRRMIGTRYKLGDAYEEYIKRGIVKPRVYAATHNGRADGDPIFFSEKEWQEKIKEMSPAIIASQMLQNPLASDAVIFQPEWIRLWPAYQYNDDPKDPYIRDEFGAPIPVELPNFAMVFLTVDGAFSKKTSADDSAIGAIGLFEPYPGAGRYSCMVIDCYMDKLSYPELRDEVIFQYQSTFGKNDKRVDGIVIEDKSSGSALIPDLQKAGMVVYAYQPGALDKVARANLVSHLVRDGYLWLLESEKKRGHPKNWLGKLYEQLLYFPNVKNDDGVDMIVQILSVLDKMGILRGKVVPPVETSYWKKMGKPKYG